MSDLIALTPQQLAGLRALVPEQDRLRFLEVLPEYAADRLLRHELEQKARELDDRNRTNRRRA